MAPEKTNTYHAYLLRLWRDDGRAPWRASLQDAHAGEMHTFASVPALLTFIAQQTGAEEQTPGKPETRE